MRQIFVLDDEETIVKTWMLILAKYGYEASGFSNPFEALAAIRSSPPDLLVSDVSLPGMTGIDLAVTLLSENIPTKVLLCSGQTFTGDYIEEAVRKGYSFDVLAKPVGPALLLTKVRELLGEPAREARPPA